MIRFGTRIRLTRREAERFKLITDLEPVGIRTLADLDAVVGLRKSVIGDQIQWDDARYLAWRYHLGREGEGSGAEAAGGRAVV